MSTFKPIKTILKLNLQDKLFYKQNLKILQLQVIFCRVKLRIRKNQDGKFLEMSKNT
jgi:hypothetical protein